MLSLPFMCHRVSVIYHTHITHVAHVVFNACFHAAPAAPTIIPEECSAENNSVTVAWQPPPQSHVEGYVLELDDGNGGEFRVSLLHS